MRQRSRFSLQICSGGDAHSGGSYGRSSGRSRGRCGRCVCRGVRCELDSAASASSFADDGMRTGGHRGGEEGICHVAKIEVVSGAEATSRPALAQRSNIACRLRLSLAIRASRAEWQHAWHRSSASLADSLCCLLCAALASASPACDPLWLQSHRRQRFVIPDRGGCW